jgi:hypothetical protein
MMPVRLKDIQNASYKVVIKVMNCLSKFHIPWYSTLLMDPLRQKALCRFNEKINSGSKIIGWKVHGRTIAP